MSNVALKTLAEQQAAICSVFANPTRILIFWALVEREKSVGEIAETVNASLQSTSQHLRIMKQNDVLTSRRDGQMIFYRINDIATMRCRLVLEAAPKQDSLSEKSSLSWTMEVKDDNANGRS